MWMSFVQSFLQWTHKSMNFPVSKGPKITEFWFSY
jgi:hypothetical protein